MLDEYGYICTVPCPTLDGKGLAHCKCIDPGRAAVCPCGHSARWEEKDLGAPVRHAVKRVTDLFIEKMKKEREQNKAEK